VWVVGSEGTGALGMMQEVAVTVILDLITKVCQTQPRRATCAAAALTLAVLCICIRWGLP
jgi:hypothetical protein